MKNTLTYAMMLAAGFAGGMLTTFVAPPPVLAQNLIVPTELRARSFVLTTPEGRPAATFTTEPMGNFDYRVVLRSPNGNTLWSAGGSMLRPLAVTK
jgi:hypothetical protein